MKIKEIFISNGYASSSPKIEIFNEKEERFILENSELFKIIKYLAKKKLLGEELKDKQKIKRIIIK